MLNFIKTMSKGTFQGLLTITGFGSLTYAFLMGKVDVNIYLPLVTMMIGYFFGNATKSDTK